MTDNNGGTMAGRSAAVGRTVESIEQDDAFFRFYPDVWMFEGPAKKAGKPRYLVQCDTVAEKRLAEALKPAFIDATIVMRGSARPRS
jgi:hypothetical protein